MEIKKQQMWKEKIIHLAKNIGFAAVGFTSSEPIEGLVELLRERKEKNYHTPFEEKELERRVDPKAVWPSCKTVVTLAYPLPFSAEVKEGEGILSRSAVGMDYHLVVKEKMGILIDGMLEEGWTYGKPLVQVDTGPLNERAFALRAGIGWVGRNQQLIIPDVGSFVAITLMLLDQELPPDEPLENLCGPCQKCADACPSQILGKDGFRANQCLSYLTQSKEKLTTQERERFEGRIFGCDSCQEVCPHNKKWLEMERKALKRLTRGVDLWQILNLTKGEFNKSFRASAAGWRGKGILQRNAFFALEKLKDPRLSSWVKERKRKDTLPPILEPYIVEEE